mmetsp:Transcript_120995/g.219970  ORF Transcript_120995/g.219970 Transcript_120995/m.219970 type:complete len:146 (-) Transcript_120995:129-566(-)
MGKGVRVLPDGLLGRGTLILRELSSIELEGTSSRADFRPLSFAVGDRECILAATCIAMDCDASVDIDRAIVFRAGRCWHREPSAAGAVPAGDGTFGCTNCGRGERVGQAGVPADRAGPTEPGDSRRDVCGDFEGRGDRICTTGTV